MAESERLTNKYILENMQEYPETLCLAICPNDFCEDEMDAKNCTFTTLYKRLADYEDTGLTPEQVNHYEAAYNKCMECPIVCIKDEYIKAVDIINKAKNMVEVVRCGECKHNQDCTRFIELRETGHKPELISCSYGERREK